MLTKTLAATLLATVSASMPLVAEATVALRLSDGLTTVTILDGGADDINSATDAVTFVGGIGVFSINVSTALGDGATAVASLHLDSINFSSGIGTLQITMTETGLSGSSAGATPIGAWFGGVAGGSIRGRLFVDDNDVLFSEADEVFDSGVIAGGAFSASGGGMASLTGPYSMTMEVIIHHPRGAGTSFTFEGTVAEPATLGLLAAGLLGAALGTRRRSSP